MLREILTLLGKVEKKHDVKVIHCVESGSRAWGFERPESDYDPRFIYFHNASFYYMSPFIEEKRDMIEVKDGALDVSGWDLRKMVKLLAKSNPNVIEWFQSRTIYLGDGEWTKTSIEQST